MRGRRVFLSFFPPDPCALKREAQYREFSACFADFAFSNCNFTTGCDFGDQQCLESENRAQNNGSGYVLMDSVYQGDPVAC